MRLDLRRPPRPQIPAVPLASIALLVLACVMISGMYSASRGPGLRFASADRDGSFDPAAAIAVEVLPEHESKVDGVGVPFAELAAAVTQARAQRPDAAVVLLVSPEATYETMLAAYGAIAALPGPPRIAFPATPRATR
jgi:biopolymer transport protein ExbD